MAALERRGGHTAAFIRAAKASSPPPPARQRQRQRRSKSGLDDDDDRDARAAPRSPQKASSQTKLQEQKREAETEVQRRRSEAHNSLRKEIQQLETRLRDQQVVRGALEKALGPEPEPEPDDDDGAGPRPLTLQNESPALKLIREVATLELEIKHLEHYLLALYRKAFEQQQAPTTALPPSDDRRDAARKLSVSSRPDDETPRARAPVIRGGRGNGRRNGGTADDCSPSTTCPRRTAADSDPAGLRSQSALSFRGAWSSSSSTSSRISPTEDSLARALRSCHSQPFSFLEQGETTAPSGGVVSLADYLGTSVADHIPETPSNLSEEMVRCMAGVYCRLADPPLLARHRPSASSASLSSAASAVSPTQCLGGGDNSTWSPTSSSSYYCGRRDAVRLINPFRVEGVKEFSGPYSAMVEVPAISRDRPRLREAEDLLQTYKLILYRLETVDLRRMTGEEKLAFWINVHNALVMHAYLKYGVPQNQLKTTTSLLVKAECKIAGRAINAAAIQGLVLGCTAHCSSGHWLRALLRYPRTTKASRRASRAGGEEWRAFAVRQPEPLLRFALCSGSYSDPAVRVYFPKRLAQQLEAARQEYVRATAGVRKDDRRVLLPRLLDAYARDAGLTADRLLDAVQRCLPETLRTAVQRCRRRGDGPGAGKAVVEWVPHRRSFRYLLARDLAFPHLSLS